MTVGRKKAALGIALTYVGLIVLVPVAFWALITWIDNALGTAPLLPRPISLILAAASVLVGVFWMSWAYSYLVFVGKGLPFELFGRALHPTRVLVTTGPYAYTRNPMILGELFVLLGVAFLEASWAGVVLVPILAVLFYLYLVEFEEKALIKRFGTEYERYRRGVPALLPRPSAYIHQPVAT